MNNTQHQIMVKEAVKSKFKGSRTLKREIGPKYPSSPEREFQRVTNGYMKLLNTALKAHLPAMIAAYKKAVRKDARFDDYQDFNQEANTMFQLVTLELERKIAKYGIEKLVSKIGKTTQKRSLAEWKQFCKETLGINLLDDYYNGDFYATVLKQWVDENVLKIKSIPSETLGNMQNIIFESYKKGLSIRDLTKSIQKEYNTSKHKAAMLARDQVSSLNARISRMQQEDAGVSRYRWGSSIDSRTRDCHRKLAGKTFSWNDPPEMWYETKKGRVYTGRRCHPGEDYCCRCVAIPVFDIDTIDLPISLSEEQK